MGLFNRDKANAGQPSIFATDLTIEPLTADYNSVIDYLCSLSDQDLKKVIKVVKILRKADAQACATFGIENKPSIELMPYDINHIEPKTTEPQYIETPVPELTKPKKQKKGK